MVMHDLGMVITVWWKIDQLFRTQASDMGKLGSVLCSTTDSLCDFRQVTLSVCLPQFLSTR